jgi:hypothetical protein
VLSVRGQAEPFKHTDRNTLRKIGEPTPNPTARAALAEEAAASAAAEAAHAVSAIAAEAARPEGTAGASGVPDAVA